MTAQHVWRIVGGAAIATCAFMAWFGSIQVAPGESMAPLIVYWGVFLVFMIIAMVCVLLDVRFIRLQYLLDRRRIFEETLGSEEFRDALRKAQQEQRGRDVSPPPVN